MSDAPTEAELTARYLPRIEAELAALDTESAATSGDRKPVVLDQQGVGRLSRMDALQGQAMASALEVRRSRRRQMLEAARARIAAAEFGWCAGCGGFIGAGRLDVDPAALMCVTCAGGRQ
ncbi:MAG: TraR/DksA C4-type zinc finger protein [Paracoccaceae bacterium]